ncbi:putative glycolipid-binding domain-containing protein [Telmatospirillum sp. J64-1]|uniref:putative glycolipid-binding domain-containing protein n=1 Tax=Telmatospirillum sp. J64-1 TaxID=2502183 RepID=UPI00115CC958|nr:putative glycolipid-binding domain-containing protein [Telmatospirillum sp. J64-1]
MPLAASILWRRLDAPGHDACSLKHTGETWLLQGTSVFRHDGQPACLHYLVECNADWESLHGALHGFIGRNGVEQQITRSDGIWILNGTPQSGVDSCLDLDLGFTPATNLSQLRRVPLAVGQSAEIDVAWLDPATNRLVLLPQRYERRTETEYWYEAPSVGYQGLLEVGPSGFIRHYPTLWRAETSGDAPLADRAPL